MEYRPYIFTHEEIDNFFQAAYSLKLKPHSIAPRRHIIMPVLLSIQVTSYNRATVNLLHHDTVKSLNYLTVTSYNH